MSDSTFVILFLLLFGLAFASLVLIKPLEHRLDKGFNSSQGSEKEAKEV